MTVALMTFRSFARACTILTGLTFVPGTSLADDHSPSVVVSIKPLHSLVSQVMGDTGTPTLLIEGSGSPHTYSLRPSQARALADADVVFWIGPDLETFLKKPLASISENARQLAMIDAAGLHLHSFRDGHDHGDHAGHDDEHKNHDEHAKAKAKDHDHDHDADHKDHDHKGGDDHDHEKDHGEHKDHDDHDHAAHKDEHKDHDHGEHDHKDHADHDDHGHDDHGHNHAADGLDPHIWLDPENAKVMVSAIAAALSAQNPDQAAQYTANAAAALASLDTLATSLKAELKPVQDKRYIVFHDAYQYFEESFGLETSGSITINPERAPGASHLAEIREMLTSQNITCVFSEPQFEPKLVQTVVEGTSVSTGVLDPLGATLPAGPDQYKELMTGMAKSLKDCLS